MHPHVEKLYQACSKHERLIIGLMSGTSLDGLDIAFCKVSGSGQTTQCHIEAFITKDYCDEYRAKVREIFAKPVASIELLCLLNSWIGRYHARLINDAIEQFGYTRDHIDFIASHGQTVYHCPREQHKIEGFDNTTLQIGDGDHIAVLTGITTLSDFRQKHVAAGGQGAPLVMYGDHLLFQSQTESRVMLNIGGIANLSFLPERGTLGQMFSSDVGPGNTMMDAYCQKHFGQLYDKDAAIARAGAVSPTLLEALMSESMTDFFQQAFPKTTGPEIFNLEYLSAAIELGGCQALSHHDVMATLCEFSATCMVNSVLETAKNESKLHVYVSGGGIHNPLLLQRISSLLSRSLPDVHIDSTDSLSINPDAKEAVLFALLANEALCSDGKNVANTAENMPAITMGKVSFAD